MHMYIRAYVCYTHTHTHTHIFLNATTLGPFTMTASRTLMTTIPEYQDWGQGILV